MIYLPNPNSSVRLANLQAGALDLVEYILPTDVPAVQKDPKLKIAMDDSLAYNGITINTGNGPAQDTSARARMRWCARRSSWRSTARR